MKKIASLLLALLAFAPAVFCQENDELLFRPEGIIQLAIDGDRVVTLKVPGGPYVQQDSGVQLFPGETLFVEMAVENGETKLKAVAQPVSPEKTITLKFEQTTTGGEKPKHSQMILTVTNPFGQALTYHARIFSLAKEEMVPTNVWPVMAGIMGIEMWDELIACILVYEFKLVD